MNKLRQIWGEVRSSFWFVPALIVALSVALAVALVEVDSVLSDQWLAQWPRLFGAGAAGSQALMSTIAGSMMSVVGVTFSVVLVALALASSQYTSRVLRNFMRSRITQVVLGIFAGIFAYCMVVIRTIRGPDEGNFVPGLAVFIAVLLAVGSVGILIFFIHHIGSSIQASAIISSIAEDTIAAIDRTFPEPIGQDEAEGDPHQAQQVVPSCKWHAVASDESGYIQGMDTPTLLRVAKERETIVRVAHPVGAFVVEQTALVWVASEDPPDPSTIATLRSAFTTSSYRTVEQDAAFGIRQLVDVALKALSPGINDVSTAVMCVDHLTAILARLADRMTPPSFLHEDEELRLIVKAPSFAGLLAEAFDQIRSSASGNAALLLRMLGALQTIGGQTAQHDRRRAILEQVQCIVELAERSVEPSYERARIQARLAHVREALTAKPDWDGAT